MRGDGTLGQGDGGAGVVELRLRLKQLQMYGAEPDGSYDANVRNAVARYQRAYDLTGDPKGVYGAETRRSLESRTDEP